MRSICREHRSDKRPLSHIVRTGNKCHTRGGISDTVYATIVQLYRLVTPTCASAFKITLLFLTPHLLTLPLHSLFLTAPFSANNPFRSIPLLLHPSPGESPSPETMLLALPLQSGGTTKPFLHFTATFGGGRRTDNTFSYHLPLDSQVAKGVAPSDGA